MTQLVCNPTLFPDHLGAFGLLGVTVLSHLRGACRSSGYAAPASAHGQRPMPAAEIASVAKDFGLLPFKCPGVDRWCSYALLCGGGGRCSPR